MSRQAYAEVATYVDPDSGDLRPADQVEVFVYEAGTTTLVSIYESRTGSTLISNPFIAGINGLVSFWAIDGDYDIKFHDTKVPARFGDYTLGWQSSPVDVEISEGELSNAGDINWERDPKTGSWIPQIKEGAVGTKEIANGAVISQKYKPTIGVKQASSGLLLTTSYQDIAGTTLEITPIVASFLKVEAIFEIEIHPNAGIASAQGTMSLDAADQTPVARHLQNIPATNVQSMGTFAQVYLFSLSAAKHTIKMRAKKVEGSEPMNVTVSNTRYLYELVAS